MRTEFVNISTGFTLLPTLGGNAGKAVVINGGGTAMTVTVGTFALAGNFVTTGAFNTTLIQGASVSLTLPLVNGTLALLASPAFTGTPTAPTAAPGTNTTQLATTAFAIAAAGAGGVVTSVAGRTGAVVLAVADVSGAAPLASPTLTGTPAAPTAAAATNTTQLATTAFVQTMPAEPPPIGNTTPNTGAFTTLSATSTVSGAGFTAWAASPPAIGSTAANTGAFTTLAASSTVSGAGFDAYLALGTKPASFTTLAASGAVSGAGFTARFATPGPIGNTSASTGAFTTLSASSTVSGAGFSTYLASPPAIGGSAAAAGSFTTLSASSTVSGAGFDTYLAAGTKPASFTTLNTSGASALSGGLTTITGAGSTSGTTALLVQNLSTAQGLVVNNAALVAIPGTFGNTTGNAANLNIAANGLLSTSTSSRRYKTMIENYSNPLDAVGRLRAVRYKSLIESDGNGWFAGMIAEEVHDAGLIEFVSYDAEGKPNGVQYGPLAALAIGALQSLAACVDALTARVAALEGSL